MSDLGEDAVGLLWPLWDDDGFDAELCLASQFVEAEGSSGQRDYTSLEQKSSFESDHALARIQEQVARDTAEASRSDEMESAEKDALVQRLKIENEKLQEDVYANQGELISLKRALQKHETAQFEEETSKCRILKMQYEKQIAELQTNNSQMKRDIVSFESQIHLHKAEEEKRRLTLSVSASAAGSGVSLGNQTYHGAIPRSPQTFPTRDSFMSSEVKRPTSSRFVPAKTKGKRRGVQTEPIIMFENEELIPRYEHMCDKYIDNAIRMQLTKYFYEEGKFKKFCVEKEAILGSKSVTNESFFAPKQYVNHPDELDKEPMISIFLSMNNIEDEKELILYKLKKRMTEIDSKKTMMYDCELVVKVVTAYLENGAPAAILDCLEYLRSRLFLLLQNVQRFRGAYFISDLDGVKTFLALLRSAVHTWTIIPIFDSEVLNSAKKEDVIFHFEKHHEKLMDWTNLITRVFYIFVTPEHFQKESRLLCLQLIVAVIKAGYFLHTHNNYERLFDGLDSSFQSAIYPNADILLDIMDIVIGLSQHRIIIKYLCRRQTDTKNCLAREIGMRSMEYFRKSGHGKIIIFNKYLNLLQILVEPQWGACNFSNAVLRTKTTTSLDCCTVTSKSHTMIEMSVHEGESRVEHLESDDQGEEKPDNDMAGSFHLEDLQLNFENTESPRPVEDEDDQKLDCFKEINPIFKEILESPKATKLYHCPVENNPVVAANPMPNAESESSKANIENPDPEKSSTSPHSLHSEPCVNNVKTWMWYDKVEASRPGSPEFFRRIRTFKEEEEEEEKEGDDDTPDEPEQIGWLNAEFWEDVKAVKTLCTCRKSLILTLLEMMIGVWDYWALNNLHSKHRKRKDNKTLQTFLRDFRNCNVKEIHRRLLEYSNRNMRWMYDAVKYEVELPRMLKCLEDDFYESDAKLEFEDYTLMEREVYGEMLSSSAVNFIEELLQQTKYDVAAFGVRGITLYYIVAGFYHVYEGCLDLNEEQFEVIEYMNDEEQSYEWKPQLLPQLQEKWNKLVQDYPDLKDIAPIVEISTGDLYPGLETYEGGREDEESVETRQEDPIDIFGF